MTHPRPHPQAKNNDYSMGRRTESNRLAHKKKSDSKKKHVQEAAQERKEKLKAIHAQFTSKKEE